MNRRSYMIIVVVLFGIFSMALAESPSQAEDPCSAPFWFEYTGDGMVGELTVEIRAANDVVHKDKFFLKLLNDEGKALGYVKLLAESGEEAKIVYDFKEPIAAASIRKVVLFSFRTDVNMVWMKVSGVVGEENYVFFDHECEGMIIGPSGCKQMKIY